MTPQGDGRFPTTHWTLIARLKNPDAEIARRALEELCVQYHYPLYCYIRRRGLAHHDAEDALHDFLAKLLRLEAFAEAEADKGRLRSYLATALQRFLHNWHRDRPHRTQECGLEFTVPGGDPEERYQREQFTERDSPERLFERKWGHELVGRALCRVGEDYAARGKGPLFTALRPVLEAGGSLRGGDTAALAGTLAMSESTLRVALSRLLRDYRARLEEEVFQTVSSRAEIEAEIAHLLGVFRKT